MSEMPGSLIFELTQACNHDCLHCYNVWKNRAAYPPGQLNTADTLAMLGKVLEETGIRHVTLTGGEPLLREDVFQIVEFLNQREVTCNLICNGSRLDEDAIRRLIDRISIFELPLLSSDRAIHDRLSGSDGAFDRVTMAIAGLKAARQRVVCVFVATRLNLPTWQNTAELAIALGADGIMFNRFNPGGRGFDNLHLLQASPAELTAALQQAERLSADYEIPISCSIAMPPCLFDTSGYKQLTFGFCAAGTSRAYYTIDPMGNLRPCNHSPRILGNLRQQPFAELIAHPRMQDFMAARPAFCAGCRHELTCQGGCKAAAEACFGCVSEPDPFLGAFMAEAGLPPYPERQT